VVLHHGIDLFDRIAINPISAVRSTRPPRTVYLHHPGRAGGNISAWGTLYYQSIKSRVILHHGIDLFDRIAINLISSGRSTRPPYSHRKLDIRTALHAGYPHRIT
jgi:pimeloyl-ACP methyl ester carboxylesterase